MTNEESIRRCVDMALAKIEGSENLPWGEFIACARTLAVEVRRLRASSEPKEPPTIDARIHQGNEVIVDVLDLTQFATVRVRGPLNRRRRSMKRWLYSRWVFLFVSKGPLRTRRIVRS